MLWKVGTLRGGSSRLWCDAEQEAPVLKVTDLDGRVDEKLKTHHEVRSFVKRTNVVLIEFPSPSFLYVYSCFWRCASPPPLPGLWIPPVVWWTCYGSKSDMLERGLSFSIITRTEHTLTKSHTHTHMHLHWLYQSLRNSFPSKRRVCSHLCSAFPLVLRQVIWEAHVYSLDFSSGLWRLAVVTEQSQWWMHMHKYGTWLECYSNLCVSVFALVSENRSVVLASTAIQLLDERKSPIAAGRWLSLSHTLCRRQNFPFHAASVAFFLALRCLRKPHFHQHSQELLLPGIYFLRIINSW